MDPSRISTGLARRDFLGRSAALTLAAILVPELLYGQEAADDVEILESIRRAERLAGLEFTDAERELMRGSVLEQMESLRSVRALALPNDVPPALGFRPLSRLLAKISHEPGSAKNVPQTPYRALRENAWNRRLPPVPTDPRELAFAPIMLLAEWIRRRELKPSELLEVVLQRLRALDPVLHFTIDVLEESAREQAAILDEEQRVGTWRGPLHGIPYGAKDLLATKVGRTTWGAKPYENQRFDHNAEVIARLEKAGAILVAKTAVGALAWGDVWFAETTRNPWKPEEGSSGSSAGSSSAVAAGALPFALGTETLGSIVSPCARCGATGIRPTFGRVPRTGCMALTWSMDKIGPIARSVEDAALVLEAIHGADEHDHDAVTAPLDWYEVKDLKKLRFGWAHRNFGNDYPEREVDAETLRVIRELGVELVPMEFPELPVGDMLTVLSIEGAAAFDELTRTDRDDELVRQVEQAWPNVFRAAQLATGVQYVQAQRARTLLQRQFEAALGDLDGYVAPSFAGPSLLITNLTGHPCVVMPNGFREDGTPTSISFIGRNYEEGKIVALAAAVQNAAGWNLRRPVL